MLELSPRTYRAGGLGACWGVTTQFDTPLDVRLRGLANDARDRVVLLHRRPARASQHEHLRERDLEQNYPRSGHEKTADIERWVCTRRRSSHVVDMFNFYHTASSQQHRLRLVP